MNKMEALKKLKMIQNFNNQNTKLSQLPSTGGMGTYIFTFVGVTLMAGAIGSHFLFGKKKSRV